jgi:uracil-DNA glycosylase
MVDGVALSALDWWVEAGVDTLVDEHPRDWLAAPAKASPAAAPAAAPAEAALPTDLAAFRQWLLTHPGGHGAVADRIDAHGDPAHGTVIVIDMPEREDRAAGRLLSGEIGALFDRMLSAIALDRDRIYLMPMAPARSLTGRLRPDEAAALARLVRHHLALAAPRRLLLLGDAPAQALLGQPAARARDQVHQLDLDGRLVLTVASIHPRLVHERADYRKPAWADLQRFAAL